MKKWIIAVFLFSFASCLSSYAQELNAEVKVNSSRIQGTNRDIFTSLERAMSNLINNEKWSTATFSRNERIDCSFTLTILEQTDNSFTSELYIQARRPVYNSAYITQILNYRDTKLSFTYQEGAPLEVVQNSISDNLTATLIFYCNLILGLDFDSFSPLGGSPFFRNAQVIANQAQTSGWDGWSAFDDNRSRTSIISAFLDESLKEYRNYWYTYHRRGLDEMAANADRGRTTILTGLSKLNEVKNTRGSEIILQMFADSKLSEVVSIAGKGTAEEKKETYDLLRGMFPASSYLLEPLKK